MNNPIKQKAPIETLSQFQWEPDPIICYMGPIFNIALLWTSYAGPVSPDFSLLKTMVAPALRDSIYSLTAVSFFCATR